MPRYDSAGSGEPSDPDVGPNLLREYVDIEHGAEDGIALFENLVRTLPEEGISMGETIARLLGCYNQSVFGMVASMLRRVARIDEGLVVRRATEPTKE